MNRKRLVVLAYGLCTHLTFLLAVGLMCFSLHNGLSGPGAMFSIPRYIWDLALLLQFPIIHSLLLTKQGRSILSVRHRSQTTSNLTTTTFALVASLQLILVFSLWLPTGVMLWEPSPGVRHLFDLGFILSWLLLGKSMWDSDITIQTGIKGWLSVFKGKKPVYRGFPSGGLYRFCRQPIYLSYLLILWTGPHWTLDRISVALVWGAYCIIGAMMKERRFLEIFGGDFLRYCERVPFMFPIPLRVHTRK